MAALNITDGKVTVELDWWEKLAARRSHLTVPRRAIRRVTVVDDACSAAGEGRRESATRIRGLTYTGTVGAEDGTRQRTFAVCHGRQPGLVIELADVTVDRIVISTARARRYAEELCPVDA
ncbi:hypothetical protein [Corynebacterium halotolerans]|uniref:Uncharacterized protein n=1 Tax=Corynebacterium halotolerans YIM 70093 = DSM 44683 TaxID=1121362 RepID=M1NJ36_9CORY|nr:hypothetical protein [Corynebacterium halotolerans]AGF71423.1 hypothetical protein A605_02045 [Corynebacterium halotolerans YIM 70093 = DSM 44683]